MDKVSLSMLNDLVEEQRVNIHSEQSRVLITNSVLRLFLFSAGVGGARFSMPSAVVERPPAVSCCDGCWPRGEETGVVSAGRDEESVALGEMTALEGKPSERGLGEFPCNCKEGLGIVQKKKRGVGDGRKTNILL